MSQPVMGWLYFLNSALIQSVSCSKASLRLMVEKMNFLVTAIG